jgi:phage tail-like protein
VRRDDWLLNQMPMGMVEDDFFARFVGIFQNVATTMLDGVDNLENVVDVTVAPEPLVRWMGTWIAIGSIDSSLTHQLQRRIVRECAKILAWRGTKRGMTALLELMSLGPVTIEDSGGVYGEGGAPHAPPFVRMRVQPSDRWSSRRPVRRAHRRRLRRRTLRQRGTRPRGGASIGWMQEEDFLTLVRNELPAHVTFELFVGDRLVWPRAEDSVTLSDPIDPGDPVDPVVAVTQEEVPV